MATMNAGAQRRRARYGEEMRQDILRAARAIIAEEGAGALSIRGIARRIGYSAPALYEYFDGKEAIARALFVSGFEELRDAMERVERTQPDPLLRVRAMGEAYRDFARAHPEEYGLMFGRPVPEFTPARADLDGVAGDAFAPLQRGFAAVVATGAFRPVDPRVAATIAWAVMHGMVSLELAGMSGPPPGACPPDVYAPADLAAIYPDALDAISAAFRPTDPAPERGVTPATEKTR